MPDKPKKRIKLYASDGSGSATAKKAGTTASGIPYYKPEYKKSSKTNKKASGGTKTTAIGRMLKSSGSGSTAKSRASGQRQKNFDASCVQGKKCK